MSHSAYGSQSTSTLRLASWVSFPRQSLLVAGPSIMTDIGNNKQKCSSEGTFQHGVTWSKFKHLRHFSKIQSRTWVLQLPPVFSSSAPSFRSQGSRGSTLGVTQTSCSFYFRKWWRVFCCHWEAKFKNVQKVHRYNTKTKSFVHSCISLALHLVPIIWFSYRSTWFPKGTKRRTDLLTIFSFLHSSGQKSI